MPYEYDGDGSQTAARSAASYVRAGVSYVLFAAALALFVSFFAPHVGAPGAAWHTAVLPQIAAPTEGDAVVDASPLIVGVVASGAALWLR